MKLKKLYLAVGAALLLSGCQTTGSGSLVDNITKPIKDMASGHSQETAQRESSATAINQKSQEVAPLPVFSGYKKIVAVSRFENRSSFNSDGAMNLGAGMRDQLADALVQSGRFVVLERQNLTDVFGEQDLARSGRVQRSQSARTGKATAAQFLVQGTITEFKINSGKGGSAVSFGGISIGGASSSTHIGLIVRMIDTTTGEVVASERVQGVAEGSGSAVSLNFGGIGFKTGSKKEDPVSMAVQNVIDKAVQAIAVKLGEKPYRGRVVQAKKGSIIVSASERNGTKTGDVFTVFSVGRELKDPLTGEILGREEVEVGQVKITTVKDKYSFAKPVGRFRLKTGDFIQAVDSSLAGR